MNPTPPRDASEIPPDVESAESGSPKAVRGKRSWFSALSAVAVVAVLAAIAIPNFLEVQAAKAPGKPMSLGFYLDVGGSPFRDTAKGVVLPDGAIYLPRDGEDVPLSPGSAYMIAFLAARPATPADLPARAREILASSTRISGARIVSEGPFSARWDSGYEIVALGKDPAGGQPRHGGGYSGDLVVYQVVFQERRPGAVVLQGFREERRENPNVDEFRATARGVSLE